MLRGWLLSDELPVTEALCRDAFRNPAAARTERAAAITGKIAGIAAVLEERVIWA